AADGRRLPFGDHVFDAVLCHSVLETLSDTASGVVEPWRIFLAAQRPPVRDASIADVRSSWSEPVKVLLTRPSRNQGPTGQKGGRATFALRRSPRQQASRAERWPCAPHQTTDCCSDRP